MVLGDINVPLPRLALPPTPSDPERSRLPLLALLAPIILALALWPLTGSPMMLAFAALSPVIALATAFEQRRALRRAKASRTAQRGQLLEQLERDVASRLDRLRVAAWGVAPTGRHVLGERVGDGWRAAPPGRLVLGSGSVPSGITLEGDATDERERLAVQAAAILTDAPVDCSAFGGIGFVGPLPLARAAARALLVQVAHGWAPHQARFVAPSGPNWEWLSGLPHHDGVVCTVYEIAGDHPSVAASVTRAPSAHLARSAAPSAEIQVFVASRRDQLPATISTVATVRAPGEAVIGRCDGADTEAPIRPGMVSQAECHSWAQRVAADPRSTSAVGGKLPTAVELTDLPQMTRGSGSVAMRLTVPIGATAYEPVSIDLVSGPHALVAGTTGSGKSELLIAWVAALARDYSPSEVSFLLIDFKGGAAFAPLTDLPHVLGVVTDLDGAAALRAVASLQSELRRREELLRAAGAREIADLPANRQCGRLVIVIDEFQAVLDQYPDVAQVVADVAARGRSLGMHLVLATQRPGGVVREQVTANCGIRICLRVLAPADSVAVIGDDRAAQLPVNAPGRVVIDGGDGDIRVAQGALVTRADLAAIQARWRDAPTAHRPWLPPLPASLPMVKVESHRAPGRYPFGLIDDPANQLQPVAFWEPVTDHNLLVIGPPRSGRSTTLSAIATGSFEPVWAMPPGDADAWEFLELLERGSIGSGVVLIDDLDVRFRSCNDEYRHTALQRLELLVRAAPAGLVFAASAARAQTIPPGLRDQFGAQVLLRHQTKADLVQAGGDPTLWFANAPVGSGQWMGRTLQVADVPPLSGDTPRMPPVLTVDRARVTIVVGEPAVAARFDSMSATTIEQLSDPEVCARLATCPPTGPVIVLGAAEHWARSWQLLAALRPNADVVVVGTLADLRAVTNSRALPPLLAAGECWLITASGAIERRRLPT